MNCFSKTNDHHLMAAEGYFELGMYLDANDELEAISPEQRRLPEVLAVRVRVYRALKAWDLMKAVASRLAVEQPNIPQWRSSLADAARHAESVEAARLILLNAVEDFPHDAVLHYNLACYECLTGEIEVAKARLKHAFNFDVTLRVKALEDPDLEAVWAD